MKDLWNADDYKENSGPQFIEAMEIVNSIDFCGDETVLDVGCGNGKITAEIARRIPRGDVLGADVSANMLREAQKDFADVSNLSFKSIDITCFACEPKFDLVTSFATLHWIENKDAAFQSIYNAMKPGARLIIKMSAALNRIIKEIFTSAKWQQILRANGEKHFPKTADELRQILKAAGFREVIINEEIRRRIFKDKQAMFNWMMPWMPSATGLPYKQSCAIANDIIEVVIARNPDKLELEAPSLVARAVK